METKTTAGRMSVRIQKKNNNTCVGKKGKEMPKSYQNGVKRCYLATLSCLNYDFLFLPLLLLDTFDLTLLLFFLSVTREIADRQHFLSEMARARSAAAGGDARRRRSREEGEARVRVEMADKVREMERRIKRTL